MALFIWATVDRTPQGLAGAAVRGALVDLVVAIAIGGAVTGVVYLVLRRRLTLPWGFSWTLLSSVLVLLTLGAGASQRGWYVTVAVVVAGAPLVGAGIGALLRRDDHVPQRQSRAALALLLAGVLVLGVPGVWLASAGGSAPAGTMTVAVTSSGPHVPDLSARGPFEVDVATYGSGDDQRDRYGDAVEVTTEPVDASALVRWDERRTAHWGFGPERLPVNGRAWFPAQAGSFPLVLIAHGNDSAVTASELGFSYLAQHLASHGFVAVTVDQNFLNTSILDRSDGTEGLETARAWLLLHHLDRWRTWADDPDHPLGAKADMAAVGLVGHSRGGAAVSLAARLVRQGALPGAPEVDVPDGLTVGAVLALAPARAHDPAAEHGTVGLTDVDYLTIQGSHDADIVDFAGLDQYEHVHIEPGSGRVKAALAIGGANHSQFNDRWGRHDLGNGLPKSFLDTAGLLDPDDQRRVAKGYATAFFASTLHRDDGPRALLANPSAGAPWLPDTSYVAQYADDATTTLDVSAADAGAVEHDGFSSVDVIKRPARTGPSADDVLKLDWQQPGPTPQVTIDLGSPSGGGTGLANPTHVVFDAVADTPVGAEAVVVTVADGAGRTASSALSEFAQALQTGLDGRYLKAGWLHATPTTELIPRTYRLPLEVFTHQEPDLDLGDLVSMTVHLEADEPGTLLLDDVGVARPSGQIDPSTATLDM